MMMNVLKLIRYSLVFLPIILIGLTCTPQVESRLLTTDEMGIVPASFEEGSTARRLDPRDPCGSQANYFIDTSRMEDYPMRYIRINMHWMNSEDGTQNIPESEAKAHTLRIVKAMNYALENNKKMLLPIGNETPIHPINFRYVLTGRPGDPDDDGIYYHYDDSLYYYVHFRKKHSNLYDRKVFDTYGVQLDTVLNFFMMPHQPDSVASPTYHADKVGVALRNALKVAATWKEDYARDPKDTHWRYRGVINHEVGHILGISHAWTNGDGCEDTPVHPNRCYNKGSGPGCDTLVSNNVMDYNALQLAWTPCQIARVHRRFANDRYLQRKFLEPRWCTRNPVLDITVQDTVIWDGMHDLHGNLTIAPGGQLTIQCRASIPADGLVIIQAGGELVIDGGYLHQDCGETWQGVQVQKVGDDEGKLTLLNGGEIKDVSFTP